MSAVDWKRVGRLMKSQMVLDGMSTKELAERLGVSVVSVNNYLRGDEKHHPSSERLVDICDIFGLSLDYLIGRDIPTSEN